MEFVGADQVLNMYAVNTASDSRRYVLWVGQVSRRRSVSSHEYKVKRFHHAETLEKAG